MKHWLIALLFFAAAPAAAQVPEIPYESTNVLQLPEGMYLGEAAGVAVNSRKHIFVFHRGNVSGPAFAAAAAQLLEFGPDGKFIREIGKGLYSMAYAHAVRIDKADNIWIIDKGSDMVVKFTPEGRVAMVFGRKKEASEKAEPWEQRNPPLAPVNGQFRQPTDVTWDPAGNIFISDGYINSRIAKYDKNGDWVGSFGEPGTGPGQLNTPHSIAADAGGNLYVADRGNRRIQVFDSSGKVLREIRIDVPIPPDAQPAIGNPIRPATAGNLAFQPGAPWAVCVTPGPTQFLYAADAYPGRIYKLTLDGKVVGMLGKAGKQPKQFGWIHEMACPSENELYVAEVLNWRVQKLTLHPNGGTATH
ncbi:MAG TPA: peptidyl-alpha-hydroxyglycine alpha-amidating lyase family protein [Vicinamibacterales bacterium]|nr:peptidyl-alpha-hydroxyglycine alpha-amidating lyase family protein [Vicinamibacterales bacterium]